MSSDENERQTPESKPEGRFDSFLEPERPEEKKKRGKLKPRTLTMLIAIAAAVVLAVVLVLITLLPHKGGDSGSVTESGTEAVYPLFDRTEDKDEAVVRNIRIDNATGGYDIRYNEKSKAYELVGYEDLALSNNVDTLVECATVINASIKIDKVEALADFGLEKPQSTVTVTYYDGKTNVLMIGDKAPSTEGYYIRLKDSNDVYIGSKEAGDYFLAANWWYVSTTLMTAPSAKEDDEGAGALLRELKLTGKSHPTPLALRRSTDDDPPELGYFKYVTTAPFYRGVNDGVGDTLYGFTSVYAERAAILHPTAEQKEKYGFNDPYAVAEVTLAVGTTNSDDKIIYYNNTKYRFTVGCVDTDKNYVVMVDGVNAIFTVSADTFKQVIDLQHETATTALLFLKDITSISRIDLTSEGKTHSFRLAHFPNEEEDDDQLTVTESGKKYSTPDFRALYVLMMDLTRYALIDEKPSGVPMLDIKIYNLDGSQAFSAAFYEGTGSLANALTSDGETFSVPKSTITHLVKQLDNYLAGKPVLEL